MRNFLAAILSITLLSLPVYASVPKAVSTPSNGASPIGGSSLSAGQIFYGNASNVVAATSPSGDVSMSNTGAFTVNKVNGAGLSSGQIYVGNASNLPAAVTPSLDVSLANTGAFTVNSFGGGNVPGSACAANTGISAGTVPLLNSNGLQFSGTGDNFAAPIAIGTTSVNSIAAQTTISTDHTQITAGARVPVASTTGVTIGNIVTGTNIASGTQLARASGGSTDTSVTAQKAAASGQTAIAVNNITGVFVNQLIYDDTTAAGLSGQTYISTLSGSGSNQLSTTGNGTSSTGQKVLTVNSTTNAAAGMLIYDNTTACIPAGTTIVSFVTNTSITLSNNITGSNCANADTIVAYPTLGLNQAIPATGVAANDTITAHPTLVLSQASTGIIGNAATLTLTANATNNTTGALQILGGSALLGDVYVSQGINYANGQQLIFVPPQDNSSLAIGNGALTLPSAITADNWIAYDNIAVGQQALGGGTMTNAAIQDTAVGVNGLKATTSGNQNTCVGYLCGASVTSGNFNTGVGRQAINALTTGSDNTAVGRNALLTISTVSDDTAVGFKALAIATGANNTGFGSNVGASLTSGANNTVVGFSVAPTNLNTGSNNILIGTSSSCDLGGSGNSNEFHLCGPSADILKATGINTASTASWTLSGTLTLTNIGSDATHTDATVCEDTTTHTLFSGSGTAGVCLGTSSKRYKHDIATMTEGIGQITDLKPVTFYYNKGYGDDGAHEQYGFIAEDVVSVLPNLVRLDKDGSPNSVDMLGILPVLVKSVQEQQQEIKSLNAQIIALGGKPMETPSNDNWLQKTIKKALNL